MPDKRPALRRRIAPSVPLEICFTDDRGIFNEKYRVSFNLNVLADIAEKTGIYALGLDVWAQFNARVLRAMLWAALLPLHPEFDTRDAKSGERTENGLEIVGSWLHDDENQERAVNALFEAYLLYLPKERAETFRRAYDDSKSKPAPEDGGVPLETQPAATAGPSSGPSAASTFASPKAKSAS